MAVITLTNDNFQTEVLDSSIPVLVDFWASWCGPCRMIGPVIEEIGNEIGDKAKVGKVNVDEQRELAEKYKVMTIPTIMVFQNGNAVATSVGVKPKQALLDMIP